MDRCRKHAEEESVGYNRRQFGRCLPALCCERKIVMGKDKRKDTSLRIAMLGHKAIPSRQGGVEIVVEELSTRMAEQGHKVTVYNRSGHHVSGKEFDGDKRKEFKNVRIKYVPTIHKRGARDIIGSTKKTYDN